MTNALTPLAGLPMFLLIASMCLPPDVYELSSPNWHSREWCEFRCRMTWPLVVDKLHRS